jgi:REP element-mobilizing transposase RayT
MVKFRKSTRLENYNYQNNGAYFVTVCTVLNKGLIGEKEKEILKDELKAIESRFDGVMVDYYAIMPDHLHVILVFHKAEVGLPRVIQAFKSLTTRRLKKEGHKGRAFWQRNYYEHIIRDEKTLQKIRTYIQENPMADRLDIEEIY